MEYLEYSKIKEQVVNIYKEGDAVRNKFFWLKERFELEFFDSEKSGKLYAKFLCEASVVDSNLQIENLDEILDDKKAIKFIENQSEEKQEEINRLWKSKNNEFISKLSNYRKNGSQDTNLSEQLANLAKNINNDELRYVYEIIQNADDCSYADEKGRNNSQPAIKIDLSKIGKMIVTYNEDGMTYKDILALTTIGQSTKGNIKGKRLIGEKGIGFKTIFAVSKSVEVHSGGYHFKLEDKSFSPKVIDTNNKEEVTQLIINLTEEMQKNSNKEIYAKLRERYGLKADKLDKDSAFKNCPVLFTEKIKAIEIKLSDEENFKIENEKIDEKSYRVKYTLDNKSIGEIECNYYKKNVEFTFEEYSSRYKDRFSQSDFEKEENKEIKTYPIYVVVPKNIADISKKDEKNNLIKGGNLYSYLPTYTNINIPFNIQLPLKLNMDRSCMWFKDDIDTIENNQIIDEDKGETISWNKRLLDEMFFRENALIEEVYEDLREKYDTEEILKYIPLKKAIFTKANTKYAESVEKLNTYMENKEIFDVFKNIKYFKLENRAVSFGEVAIYDEFIDNAFGIEFHKQLNLENKYYLSYSNEKEKFLKRFKLEPIKVSDEVEADGITTKNISEAINRLIKNNNKYVEDIYIELKKSENISRFLVGTKNKLAVIENIEIFKTTSGNLRSLKSEDENQENYWFIAKEGLINQNEKAILFITKNQIEKIGYELLIEIKDKYFKNRKSLTGEIALNLEDYEFIFKEINSKIVENANNQLSFKGYATEFLTMNKKRHRESVLDIINLLNNIGTKRNESKLLEVIKCYYEWAKKQKKKIYREALIKCFAILDIEDDYEICNSSEIESLSESECEGINETDFLRGINNKKKGKFIISNLHSSEDLICRDDLFKDTKGLSIQKCYVFSGLKSEFIRYSGIVILKEESYFEKALESIMKGLSIYKTFQSELALIREKKNIEPINEKNAEKIINTIEKICFLTACYDANKLKKNEQSNIPINELLQNANDRMGMIDATKTLQFMYSNEKFVFKYPDKGFSPLDLLAVCTLGNSGSEKDISKTGNKGTGFQSLYKIADKIEIRSKYFELVLDAKKVLDKGNTGYVDILLDDKDIKLTVEDYLEEADENIVMYPIPQFNINSENNEEMTEITLYLKESFKQSSEIKNPIDFHKILFLDNISNIKCNDNDTNIEILKTKDFFEGLKEDNQEKISRQFTITEEDLELNKRFKGNFEEFIEKGLNKVEILIPIDIKSDIRGGISCTLPIEEYTNKFPFYINIKALELKSDRNSLADRNDTEDLNDWNNILLEKVLFGEEAIIKNVIEEYAKYDCDKALILMEKINDISENYNFKWLDDVRYIKGLKSISYENGELKQEIEENLFSIKDIYKPITDGEKYPIILPEYMHRVFSGPEEFSKFETTTPFIYYSTDKSKNKIPYFIENNERIKGIKEDTQNSELLYIRYEEERCLVTQLLMDINQFLLAYFKEGVIENGAKLEILKEMYGEYCRYPKVFAFAKAEKCFLQYFFGENILAKDNNVYVNREDICSVSNSEVNNLAIYNDQINSVFNDNFKIFKGLSDLNIKTGVYITRRYVENTPKNILDINDLTKQMLASIEGEIKFKIFREEIDKLVEKPSYEKIVATKVDIFIKLNPKNPVIRRFDNNYLYIEGIENIDSNYLITRDNAKWIKENSVKISEFDNSEIIKFIKNSNTKEQQKILEDLLNEMSKKENYEIQKLNKKFIETILENDNFNLFDDEQISTNLMEFLYNTHFDNGEKKSIKWSEKFFDISSLDDYNNRKNKQLYLEFEETINLSNNIVEKVKNKISEEDLSKSLKSFGDKISGKNFGFEKVLKEISNDNNMQLKELLDITLEKLLFEKVQYFNFNRKNKGYCVALVNNEEKIVIIGDRSVGKFIEDITGIKTYLAAKIYKEIKCKDNKRLLNFGKSKGYFSSKKEYYELKEEGENSKENIFKDELIEKKLADTEWMKMRFVESIDIKGVHFKGYTNVCPICGGKTICEFDFYDIKYIRAIENIQIPMIMCKNCSGAFIYANDVRIKEKLTLDVLKSLDELTIEFDLNGHNPKVFKVPITVFLRRILEIKLKNLL